MVDDGGRGHAELPTELRMRVPAVHVAGNGCKPRLAAVSRGKRRPARVSAAGISVRVPVPRGAVLPGAASPAPAAARRHGARSNRMSLASYGPPVVTCTMEGGSRRPDHPPQQRRVRAAGPATSPAAASGTAPRLRQPVRAGTALRRQQQPLGGGAGMAWPASQREQQRRWSVGAGHMALVGARRAVHLQGCGDGRQHAAQGRFVT